MRNGLFVTFSQQAEEHYLKSSYLALKFTDIPCKCFFFSILFFFIPLFFCWCVSLFFFFFLETSCMMNCSYDAFNKSESWYSPRKPNRNLLCLNTNVSVECGFELPVSSRVAGVKPLWLLFHSFSMIPPSISYWPFHRDVSNRLSQSLWNQTVRNQAKLLKSTNQLNQSSSSSSRIWIQRDFSLNPCGTRRLWCANCLHRHPSPL